MFRTKTKFVKREQEQNSHEESEESQPVYSIEKIIKKKMMKGKPYYFVKWVGYSSNQNTWEPYQHLEHLPEMISDFETQQNPPAHKSKKIQKPKIQDKKNQNKPKSKQSNIQRHNLRSRNGKYIQSKQSKISKDKQINLKQEQSQQPIASSVISQENIQVQHLVQERKATNAVIFQKNKCLMQKKEERKNQESKRDKRVQVVLQCTPKLSKRKKQQIEVPENNQNFENNSMMDSQGQSTLRRLNSLRIQQQKLSDSNSSQLNCSQVSQESYKSNEESPLQNYFQVSKDKNEQSQSFVLDTSQIQKPQFRQISYSLPHLKNLQLLLSLLGNKQCSYSSIIQSNLSESQKILQTPGITISSIQNIFCEVKLYNPNENKEINECLIPLGTLLRQAPRLLDNKLGQLIQIFKQFQQS